jgi:hypothetical protein
MKERSWSAWLLAGRRIISPARKAEDAIGMVWLLVAKIVEPDLDFLNGA